MKEKRAYWLDDKRNVTKIFWILCLLCGLLIASDLLYHRHADFTWEAWIGFYGYYGFFSCVGLVLLAKGLRRILKRDERYYDA